MIFTTNFHPSRDLKLICNCGHPDCDNRSINQESLDRLQLIRTDINRPMIITSGGRCSYHQREVRKTYAGDHQLCYAADVFCDSYDFETKLKVIAGRHGATRVAGGEYCRFVHIAFTPTGRKDVPTWTYN